MARPNPDARMCGRLAAQTLDSVRDLMGGRRECALVDFPGHENVGDMAIWLGERRLLEALGARVRYACIGRGFSAATLRRRLPPGEVVFIHGGGNFGDLYPHHHVARMQVLRELTDYTVVQLPVSVYFRDRSGERETAEALRAHPDATILVRDRASLERLRALGEDRVRLAPDAAFGLALDDHQAAPTLSGKQVWLVRRDEEAERDLSAFAPSEADVVDWLSPGPSTPGYSRTWVALKNLARKGSPRLRHLPMADAAIAGLMLGLFDRLAEHRLGFGRRLLTGAGVVVSDRLHAHILCCLWGVPHVLVDTGHGKLRAFHEAFTADSRLTTVAEPRGAAGAVAPGLPPAR